MTGSPGYTLASAEKLEREARDWQQGVLTPTDRHVAPEAVTRAGASKSISLRVPEQMLTSLKSMARREGVGYQVLLKRWLDDRIREERRRLRDEEAHSL